MDTFDSIARANPEYVETLYRRYREDPHSVDESWALVFAGYDFAIAGGPAAPAAAGTSRPVADLVHSYRELGHLVADVDPLDRSPRRHPLLELTEFGFEEADLDRVMDCAPFRGLGPAPLRDLAAALREAYGGTLGVEYLMISDKAQREWLQERMEPSRNRPELGPEDRVGLLDRVIAAETFEQFLHTSYVGQKRFSLEGGEALIPLLDTVVEEAAAQATEELVMGMPHRGRLNVLAHILRKPYELILAEFEGSFLPWDTQGDGDVKYHLGYSHDHVSRAGRPIHLSMSANPSHLEAVNPMVEGIVRAKQTHRGTDQGRHVMPVVLHGDAAFLGQGSVYETLMMARLPSFSTGGTVHIIINNQIGFTTSPEDYRVTRYPSDPARVVQAPVFHVNGDDPEAAVQAARLAVGFRQAFQMDVFIDFVCYRRHGHNELDDPTFTQPVMYRAIDEHPSVTELYRERLTAQGLIEPGHAEQARETVKDRLRTARAAARERMPRQKVLAFGGLWKGLSWAGEDWSAATAVSAERLRAIADAGRRLPPGFTPHKRIPALLEARHAMVERGDGIDWGCAEMLAYGSLLLEGMPVRLSGQDSIRGTFSHRHAMLFDAETGASHVPLNQLAADQARIEVVNSSLSELGVVGFEYGMASADPRRLVIWEAQFGDFFNGAQVVIDQFLASAESKWQRQSGLVLFLPHGYEGQGPEHSSARPERFLQLCAEGNMQVVNCSTPAQLFHALRRQMHRRFRKPLIVLTPKSLLRHRRAVSRLDEFTEGAFQLVLGDPRPPEPEAARRVLLCSGKIFYGLDQGREERDWDGIAIIRVEQLYPFPASELTEALRRYPRVTDVAWVQEEPANQGAWSFVREQIEARLDGRRLRYIGRAEAASPATGSYKIHESEEQALVERALKRPRAGRPARAVEPPPVSPDATGGSRP
jgi:2-oxoglutarate dehydrogenase E1 component